MTPVFRRIFDCKVKSEMTWDEIARKAQIKVASWMTGLETCDPSDDDLEKLAPVFKVTYNWLKYGE